MVEGLFKPLEGDSILNVAEPSFLLRPPQLRRML
jgi:hypothetical protein